MEIKENNEYYPLDETNARNLNNLHLETSV